MRDVSSSVSLVAGGLVVALVLLWALLWSSPPPVDGDAGSVADSSGSRPSVTNEHITLTYPSPPERRSVALPTKTATLTVLVRDVEGRPVAGAFVSAGPPEEPGLHGGATDPEGRVELDREAVRGLVVHARAPGYLRASAEVSEADAPSLTLVLRPGVTISGTVLDPDGVPVVGARVLAWNQAFGLLTADHVEAALAGGAPGVVAETDGAGRFSLEGLAPGGGYMLLAGGAGHVSPRPLAGVVAPRSEADVGVRPAYASAVRITLGGSRDIEDAAIVGYAEELTLPREELERLSGPFARPLLVLAGLASEITDDELLRIHAFHAADRVPSKDYRYSVAFPGYGPRTCTLAAHRLDAPLPVVELDLPREAVGFGALEVALSTPLAPEGTSIAGRATALGLLTLTPTEAGLSTLTIPLDSLDGGRQVVRGIPFGGYELSFQMRSGEFRYPLPGDACRVLISDAPASVVIPTGDFGGVNVEIRVDGVAFDGAASFVVSEAMTTNADGVVEYQTGGNVLFSRPPYHLVGLTDGDYTLILMSPHVGSGLLAKQQVSVRPGGVADVRFDLVSE